MTVIASEAKQSRKLRLLKKNVYTKIATVSFDADSNCRKYGRLYDWNTAAVVCPDGWHLPTDGEWSDLVAAVGNLSAKLKSKRGWGPDEYLNPGTDEYGFSALPGGYYSPPYDVYNGGFGFEGWYGCWWTSTESVYLEQMVMREMHLDEDYVRRDHSPKRIGYSVRCVED